MQYFRADFPKEPKFGWVSPASSYDNNAWSSTHSSKYSSHKNGITDDWTNILWISPTILGFFRCLTWFIDLSPFTTYAAILSSQQDGRQVLLMALLFGIVPHFVAGLIYSRVLINETWRRWRSAYLFIYLPLALWTQLYTWWFPYLFRWGKPYNNIQHWQYLHTFDYTILPKLPNREVVPDLEATIYLVLTVVNFTLCYFEYLRRSKRLVRHHTSQGAKAF